MTMDPIKEAMQNSVAEFQAKVREALLDFWGNLENFDETNGIVDISFDGANLNDLCKLVGFDVPTGAAATDVLNDIIESEQRDD